MTYQDFKQILMDELWEMKPEEVSEYRIQTIFKQDAAISDCVTPIYADGGNLAPALYLEQFYEPSLDREQIRLLAAELIRSVIEAHQAQSHFDLTQITPQNAQTHLTLRMYNREQNPEILKSCAHIECMDLIAVPHWNINGKDGTIIGSFLLNRDVQHMMLHMTDEEALQIARQNTMHQDYTITGMNQLLRRMLREVPEEVVSEMMPTDGDIMFVMTNEEKAYGSTAMLFPDELKKAAAIVGEPAFYVVPSSVHELVIVPCSHVDDPADLLGMMKSVNADQVSPQERLGSENIYRFDGHRLRICNSLEEAIRQSAPLQMENQGINQRRAL